MSEWKAKVHLYPPEGDFSYIAPLHHPGKRIEKENACSQEKLNWEIRSAVKGERHNPFGKRIKSVKEGSKSNYNNFYLLIECFSI